MPRRILPDMVWVPQWTVNIIWGLQKPMPRDFPNRRPIGHHWQLQARTSKRRWRSLTACEECSSTCQMLSLFRSFQSLSSTRNCSREVVVVRIVSFVLRSLTFPPNLQDDFSKWVILILEDGLFECVMILGWVQSSHQILSVHMWIGEGGLAQWARVCRNIFWSKLCCSIRYGWQDKGHGNPGCSPLFSPECDWHPATRLDSRNDDRVRAPCILCHVGTLETYRGLRSLRTCPRWIKRRDLAITIRVYCSTHISVYHAHSVVSQDHSNQAIKTSAGKTTKNNLVGCSDVACICNVNDRWFPPNKNKAMVLPPAQVGLWFSWSRCVSKAWTKVYMI